MRQKSASMKTQMPVMHRDFDIEVLERASKEGEAPPAAGQLARHQFAVSSEFEVERRDWWTGERWIEILGHKPEEIDDTWMRNGLPVLRNHYGDQIGTFEKSKVSERKIRGDIIFSRSEAGSAFGGASPRAIEQDVIDGIRKRVSVGYQIITRKLVETRQVGDQLVKVFRATLWKPLEVSMAAIPADPEVGLGRSAGDRQSREQQFNWVETDMGDQAPEQEERTMPDPNKETTQPETRTAPAPASAAATITVEETLTKRNEEVKEIMDLCKREGVLANAADWVAQGLTKRDVGLMILDLKQKQQTRTSQPPAEQLGNARDLERYSYRRALEQGLRLREGRGEPDGLEGEVHQQLKSRLHPKFEDHGGIYLPLRTSQRDVRALDSKTAGKGLELVQENAQDLIELLRTRPLVASFGARILSDLTAPIPFPKQTGGMAMYWMPENGGVDVTDSDLGTGLVMLSPKTVMGMGKLSRQLIAQASIDSEAMVRDELVNADARIIDKSVLHGAGVNGEPTGIYVAPDVNVKAMGGVPDYPKIIDCESAVADKQADVGNLAWMTTPLMAGKMMQTLEFSAAGARPIWTGTFREGVMGGYRAGATNQVRKDMGAGSDEHGMIFGNWNDVVIGFWGGIEVTVDPYTLAGQAMLRVISYHLLDVILRHGESFTKATGAKIA